MGTRSITRVQLDGETLVAIYRQYDGYISGHGKDLADFLNGRQIVNGIRVGTELEVFNGPGCLAANLISFLKKEENGKAGNIYIREVDTEDQEYSYDINVKTREPSVWAVEYEPLPTITVRNYDEELFRGTSTEYIEYVKNEMGLSSRRKTRAC
jgi:hypothetical protein